MVSFRSAGSPDLEPEDSNDYHGLALHLENPARSPSFVLGDLAYDLHRFTSIANKVIWFRAGRLSKRQAWICMALSQSMSDSHGTRPFGRVYS